MRSRSLIVYLFLLIIIGISILIFNEGLYISLKNWLGSYSPTSNFVREIGTNKDLWLNGYLGIFFRFKMFGWVNWLAIPLVVNFLIFIKDRERWEIAVCLSLILTTIFICFQGYANFRYQLTLFPIVNALTFICLWQFVRVKNRKVFCGIIFIGFFLLVGNIFSLLYSYKYYFDAATGNGKSGESFPYKMIEYINNSIDDYSIVKTENEPILYYYTNKKSRLAGKVNEKYVFLRNTSLSGHDLVFEDEGYKLYKKSSAKNTLTIEGLNKKDSDFEADFSSMEVGSEVIMGEISTTLSPMVLLGHQNKFSFKHIVFGDNSTIRVKLSQSQFNKKSEIQFGYFLNKNGFDIPINEGDTIFIAARMKLNSFSKTSLQLFVQDKTEYWLREKSYYKGTSWQDVVVSKKIRNGVSNICMGIYWEPQSAEDLLEIQSIRIYVQQKD